MGAILMGAIFEPEPRSRCLDEAKAAICGDRDLAYGQPEDNFARIATMWNAWWDVRQSGPFDSADVAIMLGLMKDARLANNKQHPDSWRDKAGYAACGYEITEGL